MSKLLNRLKTLKSLKSLRTAQAEDSDVAETPSDPSVMQAQAHLPEVSPSSSYQGGSPASNVVQTPTCQAVAEAEAELSPSGPTLLSSFSRKLQRPRQTSVEFSLAEPAPRQKSLVGLRGAGRSGKWLTSSKSSPNLQVPPSSDIVVLGKECRSRRRLTIADDEATGSNTSLPELKGQGSGTQEKPLERRSSSTAALYKLIAPLPSPFLEVPLTTKSSTGSDAARADGSSSPTEASAQSQYAIARPGSPNGPGLERRQLSRKITSGKLVLSTEPLEEQKGDIMLPPQVVDFAADALANMGGSYTGEIEFSGGSARAIRRLSRHTSQEEAIPSAQISAKTEVAAA